MMRCVFCYYDLARRAIVEEKLNWSDVKEQTQQYFDKLWKIKFEVTVFMIFEDLI